MNRNTRSIKAYLITLIFLLFFSTHAFASGYLLFDTGYRYDRIDETLNFYDDATFPPAPTADLADLGFINDAATPLPVGGSDHQSFQSLKSYQVGAKVLLVIPCTNLLLKGSGHYSWTLSGLFPPGYSENYIVKGDLRGEFIDGSAAIGYIFPICRCCDLIPLFGGSYDAQRLRVKNSRSNLPGPPNVTGSKWRTDFYGPWGGFDVCFQNFCRCPITFDAGYEFHYGWANIKWRPKFPNPAMLFYPYDVHFQNMIGNVFHIQALYPLFCNWLLGFNVQYTYWKNTHTTKAKIPGPVITGLPPSIFQRETLLSWRSLSATFNLGLCF